MPHFVISHRRAGRPHPHQHTRALEVLEATLAGPLRTVADLVYAHRPTEQPHGRHVAIVETEAAAVQDHAQHADLIVEPLIEHHIGRARQADTGRAHAGEKQGDTTSDRQLPVRVTDDHGQPLEGLDVFADFGSGRTRRQSVVITDANGSACIGLDDKTKIHELAVAPSAKWWPLVFENPNGALKIQMMPLPPAEQHLGWWHRRSGIEHFDPARGAGVRIGVIDSGLGQHPALSAVQNLGAIVDCRLDPNGGQDIRGHGTHVCGAIAARPDDPNEYGGLAPGASVCSLRVFGESGSAHQADIALALHFMAHDQHCHLVNLSLGTTERSELVADAIADARQAGCLTICAAGNGNDAVEYPAALSDSVAVAALGIDGWGPAGSLVAHRRPDDPACCARPWFIANFSCHGAEVDAAAPGVGIIATVPGGQYAAYSGTSMAAPQLTGLLAVALARQSEPLPAEADSARTEAMEKLLYGLLHDLGLAAERQGKGRISLT